MTCISHKANIEKKNTPEKPLLYIIIKLSSYHYQKRMKKRKQTISKEWEINCLGMGAMISETLLLHSHENPLATNPKAILGSNPKHYANCKKHQPFCNTSTSPQSGVNPHLTINTRWLRVSKWSSIGMFTHQ